jgi:hypothetical protein
MEPEEIMSWSFIICTVHVGDKIKEGMIGRAHCVLGREEKRRMEIPGIGG